MQTQWKLYEFPKTDAERAAFNMRVYLNHLEQTIEMHETYRVPSRDEETNTLRDVVGSMRKHLAHLAVASEETAIQQ